LTYRKRVLRVDLSTGNITDIEIIEDDYRKFLGGAGLACKILLDFGVTAETDPLGPDNILVVMTGPLTGTSGPSTGRFVICTKSPLTDLWGESNSGGKFGPYMKFAGIDGLIITGKAEKPVYLELSEGNITIKDATGLCGKGFFKTEEELKADNPNASVLAIGPAGENLVKFACVINDGGRAAGRCGIGAVFGSKNLKGIIATGSDRKLAYFDKEKFHEISAEAKKLAGESFSAEMFSELGTAGFVDSATEFFGSMSTKYYTQHGFDSWNLSGTTMKETILVGKSACFKCPISCGRIIEIKEGKYALPRTHGPEYETTGSFGSNLLVDNLEGVSIANYFCNDLGLDTIETGNFIGFLYYLQQEKLLPEEFKCEFPLEWGNIDTAIELVKLIARADGPGSQLKDGPFAFAKKHGLLEHLVHINGMTTPYHDPRAFAGMAIAMATSPRGADHVTADMYNIEIGIDIPELGINSSDRFENKGKGRITALLQDYRSIFSSAIQCIFSDPPVNLFRELINAATGHDYSFEDFKLLGERIFTIKRLFNLKMGYSPISETLPRVYTVPFDEGATEGNVPDLELQLGEWYSFRDYDRTTGYPSAQKLKELDLEDFLA